MSDAQAIDFFEARMRFRQISRARHEARLEAEKWGLLAADAEHDYRKNLAVAFAQYRADGEGAGAAELRARGDVAEYAKERDRAIVLARSAHERIAELEADRASLNRLAEWSLKLDPAGLGAAA